VECLIEVCINFTSEFDRGHGLLSNKTHYTAMLTLYCKADMAQNSTQDSDNLLQKQPHNTCV